MLEITSTTTVPVLREHAKENNIDIRGLTRRNDIIKAIQQTEADRAAKAGENNAAEGKEAFESTNTPPNEENVIDGKKNGDDGEESNDPPPADGEGGEKNADTPPPNGDENDDPPPEPPDNEIVFKRVLLASRLLMKGEDVDAVHAALIERGLHVGTDSAQGIYGAKTAVAVRHFQVKSRLIVDGKVGKFTATALGFKWEG